MGFFMGHSRTHSVKLSSILMPYSSLLLKLTSDWEKMTRRERMLWFAGELAQARAYIPKRTAVVVSALPNGALVL